VGATIVQRKARAAAESASGSRALRGAARAGLVARAVFYLLLAGLAVDLAVNHGETSHQANANGALSVIAGSVVGVAAIAATALGFFALGVTRVIGAVRDRRATTTRRLATTLHGLFYVALTWVPLSFVLGSRSTGSEQQQRSKTAHMMSRTGGREIVVVIGVIVLLVCAWQIKNAVTRDFADGLALRGSPSWVRRLVKWAGIVGIIDRALVFLPVGVFLIVAAVQADPNHAKGLDAELATLARQPWGPAVLIAVAAGLVIFAFYCVLEARYRRVTRSD